MTTWVENPRGGRERGPRGLARAWVEILVRPRRFFRTGIGTGDQAPGLVFGMAVALAYAGTRLAIDPSALPAIVGPGALGVALTLLAVALFVAPAALHLSAALATVALIAVVPDRAGVSETVQVLAYAAAPCALGGLPVPGLRIACGAYGTALLVLGLCTVHRTTPVRAVVAGAAPAVLIFGYGFRAFAALGFPP